MTQGVLYLVATPIGNLDDITMRALNVLKSVDCIAAEDTRHTKKLLTHFNISKPLISFYDHVERVKSGKIIAQLQEGKSIALVSDSGTPLICDPGYTLVQEVIHAGVALEVIPGPSACIAALTVSGLAVDRFTFEGYLPRSPQKRRKFLRTLADEERTMICYESPHRFLKALHDIVSVLGDRRIAVVRELTKKFEEVFRGRVSDARVHFEAQGVKGEFVIIIEGKKRGAS